MSGESQRWLYDDTLPPPPQLRPAAHQRRFDVGDHSPPHTGHWSLAESPSEEIQRVSQLDRALECRLRELPLPPHLEASLHALIDTLADDLTG